MRKLLFFALFACLGIAYAQRTPQINLYTGDPAGAACAKTYALVQSTTTGAIYACIGNAYTSIANASGYPGVTPDGSNGLAITGGQSIAGTQTVATQAVTGNQTVTGNDTVTGTLKAGSAVFAGGPYLDITAPQYGGICDGASHVVNGVDLNVAAVTTAFTTWKAGGYVLGNPTGASCVFTQQVAFAATAGVQSQLIIDMRGGAWHSQVTATPVARILIDTGGTYSVCPTGVTVAGTSIPATITCSGSAITSVVMTTPSTGSTFSGKPTVAFTGGTGTAATAHAVLSGAFNFTIANPGSGSITLNGGLLIEHDNFVDDGDGAAVLVNVDGSPYAKAFFPKVSLNHSSFKTNIEATTAFQSISTFESSVYDCSFVYGGGDPSSASVGYYGFALLAGGVGQGTGEWTIQRSRSSGFEHGFYTASTVSALNFLNLQPLSSYEEGIYVLGSANITGVHTESNWNNNPNESTYRAGTYCSGNCVISGVNDLQSGKGNSNYAVSLFAAAGQYSSILGGWSFNEGQDASGTVVSATIAAAGAGGTDGTQTVTGTTGTGTKVQVSVTISGGAITAIKSFSNRGTYSVNPTTPANEPVTSGGLTGAALNLVMGTRAYNYAVLQGQVGGRFTLLGIPALNGASDYTPVNGNATILDSNQIPIGGAYAVDQSTLQWIQTSSGNSGYYAIGVSGASNSLPETYNALSTGTTGTYIVFGQYTDAAGNFHQQLCSNFTGVTPPALGTPSGCADKIVNPGWRNSDPSSPANGWEYYNTSTKVKKFYDGAAWQSVAWVSQLPVKITNSITPAAATASQCAEQTFTYTGLVTGQNVRVSAPSLGAHIWIGNTRVSASDTLAIAFCADATAGTPAAGNYIAVAY